MRASGEICSKAWPRRPLAACVAATLMLLPLSACAISVVNCQDAGAGSLRAAAAATASGGTIDMSGLTAAAPACATSTITLTTGQIDITQNKLTIIGPGQDHLTISGGDTLRVFRHQAVVTTPNPELYISGVTISAGFQYGSAAKGACILGDSNLTARSPEMSQGRDPQGSASIDRRALIL